MHLHGGGWPQVGEVTNSGGDKNKIAILKSIE